MSDLRYLTLKNVLEIHDASLAKYGGTEGTRDKGGIESAICAPEMEHHYTGCDLFAIAAAYAFHIAEAQAFLDGNKRTALASALLFLRKNGVSIRRSVPPLELHQAMIAIAEKRLDKAGLAQRFRGLFGG